MSKLAEHEISDIVMNEITMPLERVWAALNDGKGKPYNLAYDIRYAIANGVAKAIHQAVTRGVRNSGDT